MREVLGSVRRRWEVDRIGPLPSTYVPPMNRIDSVGMAAVAASMPEVRVVASAYTGDTATGSDREFGPEPWAPRLYALPRATAGYTLTDEQRLLMTTVLHTVGGWGHFVHPDEVLANADRDANYRAQGLRPPSERGWRGPEGLYHSLRDWLALAREHYAWAEGATATEAAERMRAQDRQRIAWSAERAPDGRQLTLHTSLMPALFLVPIPAGERLVLVEGGEVVDTWLGPLLGQAVVRATRSTATVTFRPIES